MGWICPRCGAENAFAFERCAACGRTVGMGFRWAERVRAWRESSGALRRLNAGRHLVMEPGYRARAVNRAARGWLIACLIACAALTAADIARSGGRLSDAGERARSLESALMARAQATATGLERLEARADDAGVRMRTLCDDMQAARTRADGALAERIGMLSARAAHARASASRRFQEFAERTDGLKDLSGLLERLEKDR